VGNQDILGTVFPLVHPNWDLNSHAGKEALTNYCWLIMGVQAAAQNPTNLSKVNEVIKGSDDSPAAFLECLLEAYRTYTPINPEAAENGRAINIAFGVGGGGRNDPNIDAHINKKIIIIKNIAFTLLSASDIRKKL
jgi:hypothetical protein